MRQPPNRYHLFVDIPSIPRLPGPPLSRFQISERPHIKILAPTEVPSICKVQNKEFLIWAAWPVSVSKKSPNSKVQLPKKPVYTLQEIRTTENWSQSKLCISLTGNMAICFSHFMGKLPRSQPQATQVIPDPQYKQTWTLSGNPTPTHSSILHGPLKLDDP